MDKIRQSTGITAAKHVASPYHVRRLFVGSRSGREVVADLIRVHNG